MDFIDMVYFAGVFLVIMLLIAMIGKHIYNKKYFMLLLLTTSWILGRVSAKYVANIMHNTLLELTIGSLIFCIFFGGVILLGKFLNNL